MSRTIKRITVLSVFVAVIFGITLIRDRQMLNENLIRLHVVGASDRVDDQNTKLLVRDAIVASLSEALRDVTDVQEAKLYIETHLPEIESVANDTLRRLGIKQNAVARFMEEEFPAREYETFSLPSGVYRSLRIVIGDGSGQNWWCVVFPSLCLEASSDAVEDEAAGAGFSQELTDTITGKQNYKIRFYLLDVLGKIENFFFVG